MLLTSDTSKMMINWAIIEQFCNWNIHSIFVAERFDSKGCDIHSPITKSGQTTDGTSAKEAYWRLDCLQCFKILQIICNFTILSKCKRFLFPVVKVPIYINVFVWLISQIIKQSKFSDPDRWFTAPYLGQQRQQMWLKNPMITILTTVSI